MRFELAVNVSPRQLEQETFADVVRACLRDTGFPPAQLTLELTETALVEDPRSGAERLAALRALGIKIALDDFGTGHSTIAQLQRMPIDIVKIDRSFTQALGDGGQAEAVTSAAIRFAHDVGLWTVCEGIETATQAQRLLALGSRSGQGYFFSRPVPAHDFETLLRGSVVRPARGVDPGQAIASQERSAASGRAARERALGVRGGEVVLEDAGGCGPAERAVGSVVIVEVDDVHVAELALRF